MTVFLHDHEGAFGEIANVGILFVEFRLAVDLDAPTPPIVVPFPFCRAALFGLWRLRVGSVRISRQNYREAASQYEKKHPNCLA
jgi:hypothetical protein